MKVWIFSDGKGVLALTDDASGKSLPPVEGGWRQLKKVTLAGADQDDLEAQVLIQELGFCCFDE